MLNAFFISPKPDWASFNPTVNLTRGSSKASLNPLEVISNNF